MTRLTPHKPIVPKRPLTAEDIEGDLIQKDHPLFGIVWVNPQRVSGAACFAGTRVPIETLFTHLEAGDSLETFLDDFPGVTREQAVALLEISRLHILDELTGR
jgi:uncharacterized protein (DUF433 family)